MFPKFLLVFGFILLFVGQQINAGSQEDEEFETNFSDSNTSNGLFDEERENNFDFS